MGIAKRSFSPDHISRAQRLALSDDDVSIAESPASDFWGNEAEERVEDGVQDEGILPGQRDLRSYFSPACEKSICVICGPSGAGKSTLIKKLMEEFPGRFGFSVSHTTRAPRPGEQNGVDYHFTGKEDMQQKIAAGDFVEHAEVHGNFYGTSVTAIQTVTEKGQICLLDIDVQGAHAVRKSGLHATALYMFLSPPSMDILEARLRQRGTETEEKIIKRLTAAKREFAIHDETPNSWDISILNNDVDTAYEEFRGFLTGATSHCPAPATPPRENAKRLSPSTADATPPKKQRARTESAEPEAFCTIGKVDGSHADNRLANTSC